MSAIGRAQAKFRCETDSYNRRWKSRAFKDVIKIGNYMD